jgi:Spy/CpxP family protein refolding chaperone
MTQMKTHVSQTILVLAVAWTLTSFANAQFKPNDEGNLPPPSMVGLPGASRYGTDPLHLLQTAKVKKELKITDEQSAQLGKIADKYHREAAAKLGNGRTEGLNAQSIRQTGDKLIESSRQEVSSVLNPEQLNRLKQILVQVNGPESLQDKEVAKQVGFTAGESEKLKKLLDQTSNELRSSLGAGPVGINDPNQIQKFGANPPNVAKIDNQVQNQYLGVMTAEQKQKLETLRGAPFTLDKSDVVGK